MSRTDVRFADRSDAGRALADRLGHHRGDPGLVVLGLPRGGVPVAAEVATALEAPLDVFLVRKLGAPGHPELAMGAIASGGLRVLNPAVLEHLRLTEAEVEEVARREATVLAARERYYRGQRDPPALEGATVILVDDGVATGASMRAALHAIRRPAAPGDRGPSHVIVAVPVAAAESVAALEDDPDADEVVCVLVPEPFHAVGLWYEDFSAVADDEVRRLLA